jgi:hypothetical protein
MPSSWYRLRTQIFHKIQHLFKDKYISVLLRTNSSLQFQKCPNINPAKLQVNFTLEQSVEARRIGGMAPYFFNFGTRWKSVVNATPWPHYPPEKGRTSYCKEGYVGITVGLDGCGKFYSPRDSI